MRIGVDYYPEQWDKALWIKDADMMAQAGVKLVRLGEFAWSLLEPHENTFDFSWLNEIIEILTARGLNIVMCTPTCCPPLWLYEKYPEAVQTAYDGKPISTGIRGHRCFRSPALLRRIEILIDRMAENLGNNPHITAWQIDNELEANFCRCKYCTEAFREYVKGKYHTLDNLNKAYGTAVWSGSFSNWSQVLPPANVHPKGWYNPALNLDYHRFASEDTAVFTDFQIKCIRKHYPDVPITTNAWFCNNHPAYHKLYENMDFVSYDNYPAIELPEDKNAIYSHAFHLDFMRGIKNQNFWIMEQLSGAMGSWTPMGHAVYPGQIKGYALQAFAHGADTVVHFRWRTAVQGAEMFWHGILDHSNVPVRRFNEFTELCREAERLSSLSGSKVICKTAVIYDSDTDFAFDIQPQTDGFHYLQQLKLWHDGCISNGVNTDIISSSHPLDGYDVVIAPALFVNKSSIVKKLHDFAEKGGTVVLTARSGVKDEYNGCIMDSLPTVYRDMTKTYAEEYCPLGWKQQKICMDGKEFAISQWCDILNAQDCETLAVYCDSYYKGKAAAVCSNYGNGKVYYIGTVPERSFCKTLMSRIFKEKNIKHCNDLPLGVEVTERLKEGKAYTFIFNNTMENQNFRLYGKDYSLKAFEMVVDSE